MDEKIINILHDKGMVLSYPRIVFLEGIYKRIGYFTMKEIIQDLKEVSPYIAQSTAYCIIRNFRQKGILECTDSIPIRRYILSSKIRKYLDSK